MNRDTELYIEDIIKALEYIEQYISGLSLEVFRNDQKTQDAVIRNFEIIGEAVKRMPEAFKLKYPEIPWRSAAGMRDVLIHDYPDNIPDVVWTTATQNLPKFKSQILRIKKSAKWADFFIQGNSPRSFVLILRHLIHRSGIC